MTQDNRAFGSADADHHARTPRRAATYFIDTNKAEEAILDLPNAHPELSAKDLPLQKFAWGFGLTSFAALCCFIWGGTAKLVASLVLVIPFAGAILIRLIALASGLYRSDYEASPLQDDALPSYTILIPLFREEAIILHLIESLDRLDYPRSKLQILLLLEEEDIATRAVLERLDLGPHYTLIIIAKGEPQTKPRALNVGLSLARGDLTCIYDAEDDPNPSQLRNVAAIFAQSNERFVCLQCPLNIYNAKDSWLSALFALDYAALFHLLDPGLANLRLPVPLGGTSNHFRTQRLRDIHGWDAWNVTEDADIGIRLARRGYLVGTSSAPTFEEAPAAVRSWLMQRKRWMKGWMQTLCVLLRDPAQLPRELGWRGSFATLIMLSGGVLGPLSWPFFALLFGHDILKGTLFDFSGIGTSAVTVIWSMTALLGLVMAFLPLVLGAQRCKITHLLPKLVGVPALHLLLFVAAVLALWDLFARPHYWDKTDHGHALQKPRKTLPFG